MSEAMSEFMCLPREMQKEILKEQGIVSTITHSPKQVAKHFIKWRAKQGRSQVKVNKVKSQTTKRKLRDEVLYAYSNGMTVAEAARSFSITYANAHYYYRVYGKQC
jgi:hypothetical protein